MPTVGTKKFPYTPKGEKAAKAYAKKTGKKMTVAQDKAYDKKHGIKEGSKKDKVLDKARGVEDLPVKLSQVKFLKNPSAY